MSENVLSDKELIAELRAENAELRRQLQEVTDKLNLALQMIEKLTVKKNSKNSSIPPSQDPNRPRKTNSLRKKGLKPSGGQAGHKGHTLKAVETPDEIHDLKPNFCGACGNLFSKKNLFYLTKRQQIDVPPIALHTTEFRQFIGVCSCGNHQKASFPQGVNAPVQYGPNIEALVGYLSSYQYLPYQRMTELFKDLFGVSLSQGTVDNMLIRLSEKGAKVYEGIRQKLENSEKPVGADESSCHVDGEIYWAWVWQNDDYSYLAMSENRGKKTVDENFSKGFPRTVLSSDRWPSHLNTPAKAHQICMAHILRELEYLEALEKHPFVMQLQKLLRKAIQAKKEHRVFAPEAPQAKAMERELTELLAQGIDKEKYPKTNTLQHSLIRLRAAIFPFLYHENLAPDNNASERAIRNVKVKQKVSGQFKTGQNRFAVLRSIVDTLKKQGKDIFDFLVNLAKTQPQWSWDT
ncbi:MAG: IS66 family transposase [Cytophagales bacterium]|nr:IS66 family transposase [Cytophagales bacterium]